MDEIARRREARRLRILNNLETRLQKLSGVQNNEIREFSRENERIEAENEIDAPVEPPIEENEPFQPQVDNNVQQQQPQKQYRNVVIMGLAVFVNVHILIFERLFKIDMTSSHLNKIFVPILLYEIFEYMSSSKDRRENKNFLYLLIMTNAKINHILPLIKYIDLITSILQDVMIYFFVYMCCDLTKNGLLWIFS